MGTMPMSPGTEEFAASALGSKAWNTPTVGHTPLCQAQSPTDSEEGVHAGGWNVGGLPLVKPTPVFLLNVQSKSAQRTWLHSEESRGWCHAGSPVVPSSPGLGFPPTLCSWPQGGLRSGLRFLTLLVFLGSTPSRDPSLLGPTHLTRCSGEGGVAAWQWGGWTSGELAERWGRRVAELGEFGDLVAQADGGGTAGDARCGARTWLRKSEAARTALPASLEPVGRSTVGARSGRGSARAGGAASSRSSLQRAVLGAQEQMAALRAAGPPSNPPLVPATVPGATPPSRSSRARPRQGLLRTENWGGGHLLPALHPGFWEGERAATRRGLITTECGCLPGALRGTAGSKLSIQGAVSALGQG
ncbi:unnamed protein product [Rangifer tarandus platyrhynchus]|uniref:Uncharacterized protein n=1 Tax=Rangifer tarandus platyrhynchus TaxID=3082113 RepID=A0AC59YJF4_RANTA